MLNLFLHLHEDILENIVSYLESSYRKKSRNINKLWYIVCGKLDFQDFINIISNKILLEGGIYENMEMKDLKIVGLFFKDYPISFFHMFEDFKKCENMLSSFEKQEYIFEIEKNKLSSRHLQKFVLNSKLILQEDIHFSIFLRFHILCSEYFLKYNTLFTYPFYIYVRDLSKYYNIFLEKKEKMNQEIILKEYYKK